MDEVGRPSALAGEWVEIQFGPRPPRADLDGVARVGGIDDPKVWLTRSVGRERAWIEIRRRGELGQDHGGVDVGMVADLLEGDLVRAASVGRLVERQPPRMGGLADVV